MDIYYTHTFSSLSSVVQKLNLMCKLPTHPELDVIRSTHLFLEYMYQVLTHNQCTLPEEALYIVRYHSFYPYHSSGAYTHLTDERDKKMLYWLNEFK